MNEIALLENTTPNIPALEFACGGNIIYDSRQAGVDEDPIIPSHIDISNIKKKIGIKISL